MADCAHPRLILRNFLSLDQCKELEFIHKSCSTVGYRPNVFSTTLSHLIATNCAHLIMPLVPIREILKEKVEEYFGCDYELSVEFTGLISWTRGASIGWHSDDNRPYLRQRDYAAVCYLNNFGEDFKGGLFHFQDGEPTTVVPMAGDVVLYTADSRNIHSVDEITNGERLTLTLWFSCDRSHDEDAKLVSFLSERLLHGSNESDLCVPVPASSNMYWFSPNQSPNDMFGFDIRYARIHILGCDLYSSQDESFISASDSSYDISELLIEPLQLARGDELYEKEFVNVLQALQVVQFYSWKASDLQISKVEKIVNSKVLLSQAQQDKISSLRLVCLKDGELVGRVFGSLSPNGAGQCSYDWDGFPAAVVAWEAYIRDLHKGLLMSLPHWTTYQSIFSVPLDLGKES
ncbi:uncharacterized protein LOC131154356 isoform X1 [Malania oleifera]|uniref:uncharacterized protein LOC131154356 isoform X1 n=1 Tax=Malania oleifera TaxID=397392 RepID=UPI0025AE59EF|nr:uncharacterized protein LOC131154356 isoform X1 [Malania oleifera]